jgi:adenylosuccinate synthase
MPNIVIAGAQWGDEGKGKIVDLLAHRVQVVARYNGGHNAGHTVILGREKFVLHLIPSGILHSGILCVMGNGMVIDPWALEKEIAELGTRGIEVDDNLVISDRAHLILPHHRILESMAEEMRGKKKIGTTLRGIGPAYEDKAGRRGVRMGDLVRPATLAQKLEEPRRHFEQLCRGASYLPELDWDELLRDLAPGQEAQRLGDLS